MIPEYVIKIDLTEQHTPDTSLVKLNSIFGGNCLGTEITKEQREVILNKSYKGLHIGDYWEKNGIKWRIGEFGRKTPDGKDSLITIVPDEALFSTNLIINEANIMLKILRNIFSKLIDDFDFTTDLMNERMVFSKRIYSNDKLNRYAFDNEKQLALFNLNSKCIVSDDWYWLKDAVSAACFASVDNGGFASCYYAGYAGRVRPAFFIHDQKTIKNTTNENQEEIV